MLRREVLLGKYLGTGTRKANVFQMRSLVSLTYPLSLGEKLYLSKMITVHQKTTSNIPAERYCLGYVQIITTDIQGVTNCIEESAK